MFESMEEFLVENQLSESRSGNVLIAVHRRTGRRVVLKRRCRSELGALHDIEHEWRLLQECDHPGVVKPLGRFFAQDGFRSLVIVLPYFPRGDLAAEVNARRGQGRGFDAKEIQRIFGDLLEAVAYLHQRRKFIHRDIKCSNVLLYEEDREPGVLRAALSDLGVGRQVDNAFQVAHTFIGTPLYLSPELASRRPYNRKTDIWSLGIVLYELIALQHPFEHVREHPMRLFERITQGRYAPLPHQDEIPSLFSDTVQQCLSKDYNRRPEASSLISEWKSWAPPPSVQPIQQSTVDHVSNRVISSSACLEPPKSSDTLDEQIARLQSRIDQLSFSNARHTRQEMYRLKVKLSRLEEQQRKERRSFELTKDQAVPGMKAINVAGRSLMVNVIPDKHKDIAPDPSSAPSPSIIEPVSNDNIRQDVNPSTEGRHVFGNAPLRKAWECAQLEEDSWNPKIVSQAHRPSTAKLFQVQTRVERPQTARPYVVSEEIPIQEEGESRESDRVIANHMFLLGRGALSQEKAMRFARRRYNVILGNWQ